MCERGGERKRSTEREREREIGRRWGGLSIIPVSFVIDTIRKFR